MLTLDELEVLARAYEDCRLTRLQERELQLVLSQSPLRSPLLDRVRLSMTLSDAMAVSRTETAVAVPRRSILRQSLLRWGSAAACIAMIAVLALPWINNPADDFLADGADSLPETSVWINGQQLTGAEAVAYATEIEEASLAMLHELMSEAEFAVSEPESGHSPVKSSELQ